MILQWGMGVTYSFILSHHEGFATLVGLVTFVCMAPTPAALLSNKYMIIATVVDISAVCACQGK